MSFFIYIKYDSTYMFLFGQYFLKFCLTGAGSYDINEYRNKCRKSKAATGSMV